MEFFKRRRGDTAPEGDLILIPMFSVTQETVQQRLDACNACENFNKDTTRCSECGCFMRLKTQLKTSTCPLGKW